MKAYKSPTAALLWSITMAGFGQIYNKQYLLGFLILIGEFFINTYSGLNLAIYYTFNGRFLLAHNTLDYLLVLYYPSLYVFALWQAYNKAIAINHLLDGKNTSKETYLTGPCIGLVVGMNFGMYWHYYFLAKEDFLSFMKSPILSSIVIGGLFALIGYLIEKQYKKKKKTASKLG